MKNKQLMTRLLTAAVLVACVVPPILLGGIWIELLIAVITFFAAYEITALSDHEHVHAWLTMLTFAAIEIMYHLPTHYYPVSMAVWLMILFLLHYCNEKFTVDRLVYTYLLSMILVLGWQGAMIFYQSGMGSAGVFYVAIACYLSDTGAYFMGSMFGKHKMIPRISPKKTWEGAVGGLVFGFVFSLAVGLVFLKQLPLSLILTASILLPAVAEIGDLAFSAIKRRWGIKDFGSLLPGHGGVLDRVDSLMFCLIIMHALLVLWGI